MTKKNVFLGFCDGFTQGIILYLLLAFTVAHFVEGGSIEGMLDITAFLALLSPLSYCFFVLKSDAGKRLLTLSAISLLVFILTVALSMTISWGQLLFPVDKLVCFSAGMIQQLEILVFLAVSVILRLLVLMIRKIKTEK